MKRSIVGLAVVAAGAVVLISHLSSIKPTDAVVETRKPAPNPSMLKGPVNDDGDDTTSGRPDLIGWIGKPAPDFELPLFKQEVSDTGEKVGRVTNEKIRLSSFRGKKVVCLFLSSCT